jgi:MFS superfamily sulfate permease-like transporter
MNAAAAQVNKLDWIVFNAALLVTMFAGVDIGLGVSIGLSIILALYKSAFPKTAVLGRLPETTVYRCCRFGSPSVRCLSVAQPSCCALLYGCVPCSGLWFSGENVCVRGAE